MPHLKSSSGKKVVEGSEPSAEERAPVAAMESTMSSTLNEVVPSMPLLSVVTNLF